MTEVYVAVASNDRPRTHIARALGLLRQHWPGLSVSRAFVNRPVGFDGAEFINLVVGFDTDESVAAVLATLGTIEAACDRKRGGAQPAAVSLDLDLLLYGDLVGEHAGKELPRPELLTRAYMLGPLADLAPGLAHPVLGRSMGELWRDFDAAGHVLEPTRLEGAD